MLAGALVMAVLAAEGAPGETFVHLDADALAVRLVRAGGETVCTSPCDQWVGGLDSAFHILGEGMLPSASFRLSATQPQVDVKVTPGNFGSGEAAMYGIVLGSFSFLTGATFLVVAAALQLSGALVVAGVVLLIVGPALFVLGLMAARNAVTRVEVTPRARSGVLEQNRDLSDSVAVVPLWRF